jgi:hypothetical protein
MKKKATLFIEVGDDIHILPVGDLRNHDEARSCWCGPQIEQDDNGRWLVVVHHSMDGRELIEQHGLQ